MIHETRYYYLTCDGTGCGALFPSSDTECYSTIRDTEHYAEQSGWVTVPQKAADYKHYCPKCKLTKGVKDEKTN